MKCFIFIVPNFLTYLCHKALRQRIFGFWKCSGSRLLLPVQAGKCCCGAQGVCCLRTVCRPGGTSHPQCKTPIYPLLLCKCNSMVPSLSVEQMWNLRWYLKFWKTKLKMRINLYCIWRFSSHFKPRATNIYSEESTYWSSVEILNLIILVYLVKDWSIGWCEPVLSDQSVSVVMSGYWPPYLEGDFFDQQEQSRELESYSMAEHCIRNEEHSVGLVVNLVRFKDVSSC